MSFRYLLVGLCCICHVSCVAYDVNDLIDAHSGKVDLFNVAMHVYEEVFHPLLRNPQLTKNITAQSLYASIEETMNTTHPDIKTAWCGVIASLKERSKTLPSSKLTEFATSLIGEVENGNVFYYFIKDKLLLWSIQQINKIGYEALYRIWYYEHNISADVYGIIENHFNISSFDDTIRNYVNIDKDNYLYKAEEL